MSTGGYSVAKRSATLVQVNAAAASSPRGLFKYYGGSGGILGCCVFVVRGVAKVGCLRKVVRRSEVVGSRESWM